MRGMIMKEEFVLHDIFGGVLLAKNPSSPK